MDIKSNRTASTVSQTIVQTTNGTAIDLLSKDMYVKGFSLAIVATVVSPAAATFTAAVTDIITQVAHGYALGLKVQMTTSVTLPAGLALATDYFIIPLTVDTYKVASSLVLANAGTAIDITDTGTGVHTATPVALAGGSYKVQASLDSTNWVDLDAAVNITTGAVFLVQKVDPMYRYIRPVYAITAGSLTLAQTLNITSS